jgi:hypothetical protein
MGRKVLVSRLMTRKKRIIFAWRFLGVSVCMGSMAAGWKEIFGSKKDGKRYILYDTQGQAAREASVRVFLRLHRLTTG